MIFMLVLVYLTRNVIYAAPIFPASANSPGVSPTSQCLCPDQQRSIWNIIWSCMSTIFACSWVSVHPNMPAPDEKWWEIASRRMELMFWALIAPEMIILWAMRQWFGARSLKNLYHGQGWTKTHGYFAQMGGFTLVKGQESQGVLTPENMRKLLEDGAIRFPEITEEEIKDRSKGDGLSKALAVGQTSWFAIQCLARRVQGLEMTELELLTAAFAVLNGATYFLWWNKPLDARSSLAVQLLEVNLPSKERLIFSPLKQASTSQRTVLSSIGMAWAGLIGSITKFTGKLWSLIWERITEKGAFQKAFICIISSPWTAITVAYSRFVEMSTGGRLIDGKRRVSTFYSCDVEDDTEPDPQNGSVSSPLRVATLVSTSLAVIFGAIHCAGWSFTFPSHTELMLWRVCSAVIVAVPFGMMLTSVISVSTHELLFLHSRFKAWINFIVSIPAILTLFGIPIYIIARLLLLVEVFVALRDLPPGAYEAIEWVKFLPHI